MQTHIESIFHCVTCGRVEHRELNVVPPQCCGQAMTEAGREPNPAEEVAEAPPSGDDSAETTTNSNKPR